MPLTNADPHYWAPIEPIVQWLAARYKDKAVLEIGPGHVPFPVAKHFVEWQDIPGIPAEKTTKIDLTKDQLPFRDKEWDFIYCRHVLEDSWNPFHICKEMARVGKAGYIETPSPIVELTRGVDGGSPPYRGYNHHRWLVWENNGRLGFIAKLPLVEHLPFDEPHNEMLLKSGPQYWNTYHLWSGDIVVRHLQSPHDFHMPIDYGTLLTAAARYSRESTNRFWQQIQTQRAA